MRMMFCDPASAYLGDLDRSEEQPSLEDLDAVEDLEGATSEAAELDESEVSAEPTGDEAEQESKTVMEADAEGNWSKSMPKLAAAEDDDDLASTMAHLPVAKGPDLVLVGLFGGAAVLLVVVVVLLLF
jgi:hypothetical protein